MAFEFRIVTKNIVKKLSKLKTVKSKEIKGLGEKLVLKVQCKKVYINMKMIV